MQTSLLQQCRPHTSGLKPIRSSRGVRSLPARPATSRTRLQVLNFKVAEDAKTQSGHHKHQELMSCYQCEQTLNRVGCHEVGVCGKTPEVAGLQDLIVYVCKGLGTLSHHARLHGITDLEVDLFLNSAIFSTLTNVNFHDERMLEFVFRGEELKAKLQNTLLAHEKPLPTPSNVGAAYWGTLPHPLEFTLQQQLGKGSPALEEVIELGKKTSIEIRKASLGETLCGLQELVVYGLKGMCAYAHHAEALGYRDSHVAAFVAEALAFLSGPESSSVDACLGMALRVGECNYRVMEMLSKAHSNTFGAPTPTDVSLIPQEGKAILVTGHDMHDMHLLLEQTQGTGIKVYTHGEMLPAHGYPGLHKYPHLAGHFGGAWYRQKSDFSHFPGAILVTTNCVLDPPESYKDNLFTINETGVAASTHLATKDFTPLIKRALQLPGFTTKDIEEAKAGRGAAVVAGGASGKTNVTVGFGHDAVLSVAGEVIKAVQEQRLQHIFLIGGCDGNEPQRKYYSQLFKYMPQETMILTLGCGKFRIFDSDFGNLPGSNLPRLLDMGQCNDAYSALVVATELAKALKTDVNSLPLSLDLSWFEQKAVAVLLTLLHLGVRNIRLGPRLPAFLTADAVGVLVKTFNLQPADEADPEADVKKMMLCQ